MTLEAIETAPYVASNPTWQVPEADLMVFSDKRHRCVLVIPVINEGERIRHQLKAISNLAPELDIVIADGGSTDRSLDDAYLKACGVRALLVKRGPGGLSAQLRMGYAWALDQGYAGVITMDGNGKDGVDALPSFIDALEAGVDYAQGSRYAKGGKAVNTPLDRSLGVRLIHAPLISLASRRWMRDTTNGFRGYSRRLLEDDRVRPFRAIFDRYNLIFYLAISASRLGYVIRELPVERSYPERGTATPTKIAGLGSKLALFGETLDAATGAFTPDARPPAPSSRRTDTLAVGLFLALLAILFFRQVTAPSYSPDSWAYYELSKTIFADFYRLSHFRTYVSEIEYGSSFPPLWPALIAVVDTVFQTGARTGYALAFVMFAAFAILSERAGRSAFRVKWLGAGVALLTLIDDQMLLGEIVSGRSIPLQMLLFATILYLLLQQRNLRIAHGLALGALAGLAVMNRFDALLFPIIMCAGLIFMTRRIAIGAAFASAAALMISPWVYYSVTTFGSPFMTDNATVALAVDGRAFVTDWWPVSRPTLFDDPSAWVAKIIGNLRPLVGRILNLVGTEVGFAIFWSVALASVFVTLTSRGRTVGSPHAMHQALTSHQVRVFAIFALALLAPLSTYMVTGYFDARYFTPAIWLGSLIGAGLFVNWGRSTHQRQVLGLSSFFFFAALTLTGWSLNGSLRPANATEGQPALWREFEQPAIISTLAACLVGTPDDTRLLVIGGNTLAARLGALTGRRAMFEPRNMALGWLDADGARAFLKQWRVDYILVAKPDRVDFVQTTFPVLPAPNCNLDLYRVE